MDDVVPQREIVKRRHEIEIELALAEVFDRVRQHTECQRIGEHKTEYGRRQHKDPAKGDRTLSERKEHEHHGAKEQARLEPKRKRYSPAKIAKAKAGAESCVDISCRAMFLYKLGQRFAHRTAEGADLYRTAI